MSFVIKRIEYAEYDMIVTSGANCLKVAELHVLGCFRIDYEKSALHKRKRTEEGEPQSDLEQLLR